MHSRHHFRPLGTKNVRVSEGDFQRKDLVMRKKICRLCTVHCRVKFHSAEQLLFFLTKISIHLSLSFSWDLEDQTFEKKTVEMRTFCNFRATTPNQRAKNGSWKNLRVYLDQLWRAECVYAQNQTKIRENRPGKKVSFFLCAISDRFVFYLWEAYPKLSSSMLGQHRCITIPNFHLNTSIKLKTLHSAYDKKMCTAT